MNKLTLTRLESTDQGTFGTLEVLCQGFAEYFYTGELPWRENKPNISCIPTGTYTGQLSYSPRFKRQMYSIDGVKDRAGIRVHSANYMGDDAKGFKRQLNGCIALGEKLGVMENQKALLLSSPAVRRFESFLCGAAFELEIK